MGFTNFTNSRNAFKNLGLVNCDRVETRFFVGLLHFPRFLGRRRQQVLHRNRATRAHRPGIGHWANSVWTFTDPRGIHKNASLSRSHLTCEELFGTVLVCFCNTWDDECQKALKCCPADFIFAKSTWLDRIAKKGWMILASTLLITNIFLPRPFWRWFSFFQGG